MPDDAFRLATRFKGYKPDGSVECQEPTYHDEIGRSPFERDVDRLKYTRELRRLKDVTQVARARESYLYHDRLTHSLKVAQVGRRFAEYILRVEARNVDSDSDEDFSLDSDLAESFALSWGDCFAELPTELKIQLDPDAVEAGCLAHDLGHPPFGHKAEKVLDEMLQRKTNPWVTEPGEREEGIGIDLPESVSSSIAEGESPEDIDDLDEVAIITGNEPKGVRFEGNAQSFRILTRLASYRDATTGLGLTLGTLNAIQKYPYGRGRWVPEDVTEWRTDLAEDRDRSSGKFGYYLTEAHGFEAVRADTPFVDDPAITAAIMEYADDLTYAIHDLTDFYRDGRLPLDRLLREASNKDEFADVEHRELEKLGEELSDSGTVDPADVLQFLCSAMYSTVGEELLQEPYEGTPRQREELEEFTSFMIERLLNRVYYHGLDRDELHEKGIELYITLGETGGQYELSISDTLEEYVDVLQGITEYYIIQDTVLMGQQRGQREIVETLFEILYAETGKSDLERSAVPKPYSKWLSDDESPVGDDDPDDVVRARVVSDFISALTEQQAVELCNRLTGQNPGSLQNEIIR